MKYPPPDFVVEILSPSTKRKDREEEMGDYAAHGVAEYWLVDPISGVKYISSLQYLRHSNELKR